MSWLIHLMMISKKNGREKGSSLNEKSGENGDGGERKNYSLPEIYTDPSDLSHNGFDGGSKPEKNGSSLVEIIGENNDVEIRENNCLPEIENELAYSSDDDFDEKK